MNSLFKKSFAVLLTALCLMVFSVSVFADSSVTYDGNSQKFVFETSSFSNPKDLFDGFKDVMPGDNLTQKITINNKASESVKIKVYLRSEGATKESEEFLSKLSLSVATDENSNLFKAPASKTDGLNDWVCLGTVYSGGKINLDLNLNVPIELDNSFENAIGTLKWQFKVEEFPIEKDDPKPTPETTPESSEPTDAPTTGDTSNVVFYAMIFACSLVACVFAVAYKRKQNEQ